MYLRKNTFLSGVIKMTAGLRLPSRTQSWRWRILPEQAPGGSPFSYLATPASRIWGCSFCLLRQHQPGTGGAPHAGDIPSRSKQRHKNSEIRLSLKPQAAKVGYILCARNLNMWLPPGKKKKITLDLESLNMIAKMSSIQREVTGHTGNQ